MSEKNYKVEVTVAVITVIGVLGAALIANWDKLFAPKPPSNQQQNIANLSPNNFSNMPTPNKPGNPTPNKTSNINSSPPNPITNIALRKEGDWMYTDPQKGDFTVKWRKLSLLYKNNKIEYNTELSLDFTGCQDCSAQVMIWIENTSYKQCVFDGSANTSSKTQKGNIAVPQNIMGNEPVGVYLLVALERNCSDAISGKAEADSRFKQLIGSIQPSP